MAHTKWFYAESVLNSLSDEYRTRDIRIDPREVLVELDKLVNARAKQNFLDNVKLGFNLEPDEMYLTRLEWLTPTDPANGAASYVTLTSNYVSLPEAQGIHDVYFKNDFSATKKKYFDPVLIRNRKDKAAFRSNMAASMEGRISCWPKGMTLEFDRGNIGSTYGDVGVALVVRNFETLSDNDIYPIGSADEAEITMTLVKFFRDRLTQPKDLIRDATNEK